MSGDLISKQAAIAELSLLNELLHRQFEALEISREDGVYQICIDAIRALRAAPAVKVKPLTWEHGKKFCGQECSYADTEFGAWMMVAYSGRGLRWAHTDPAGNDSEDDWETRDECQAAANADYQARILAALERSDT